jgi:hypothetical protein
LGIIEKINEKIKKHSTVSVLRKLQSEINAAKYDIELVEKEINLIVPKSESNVDEKSYFRILGIKPTKDKVLIKQAYRSKAMQYHPDVKKINNSEEMMKELNKAYSILSKNSGNRETIVSHDQVAIESEKKFISIYMKLRESDYSTFMGAARSAGSMDEVIGLAHSVTDWKDRAAKAQKLMIGKLDSRAKALEKRRDKFKKLLQNAQADDPICMHAREVNSEISGCLEDAKALQYVLSKAIDSAIARITPLEEEQKKKLFSSLR